MSLFEKISSIEILNVFYSTVGDIDTFEQGTKVTEA